MSHSGLTKNIEAPPRMTCDGTRTLGDVYAVDTLFDSIVITLALPVVPAPTASTRRAST
jgi:hypothetical protein